MPGQELYQDSARRLGELWAGQLAEVLEVMLGRRPEIRVEFPAPPPPPGLLWWEQRLGPNGRLRAWLGTDTESWRQIGETIAEAAGLQPSEGEALAQQNYLETIQQVCSGWSRLLSETTGKAVELEGGSEVPEPGEGEDARFELDLPSGKRIWLQLRLSRSLVEFAASSPVAAQPSLQHGVEPADELSLGYPMDSVRNIQVVLDIELPMSVSFGRAYLPLKEVLKLNTGSIVELDRTVSDPVELIINNRVIARGEVVVVDGNYGVRILEIVSPQERMDAAG